MKLETLSIDKDGLILERVNDVVAAKLGNLVYERVGDVSVFYQTGKVSSLRLKRVLIKNIVKKIFA